VNIHTKFKALSPIQNTQKHTQLYDIAVTDFYLLAFLWNALNIHAKFKVLSPSQNTQERTQVYDIAEMRFFNYKCSCRML
jgi:hypothetical protein